jgi:signal transduction histidine kinase
MALVKKICDAYHADIQIDSEKDRGTTCTITFQKHLRQKVEAANDE